MRAGVLGSILVVGAGGAAAGAVFLRDTAQLSKAQKQLDQAASHVEAEEWSEARGAYVHALEAAAQVGHATGRGPAAQTIETEARRWVLELDRLLADDDPRRVLKVLEGEGTVLGVEVGGGLSAEVERDRARWLLEAGRRVEAAGGDELAPALYERAQTALQATGGEGAEEAQRGLARTALRVAVAEAVAASRNDQDAVAARQAREAQERLERQVAAFDAADEVSALRAALEGVLARAADLEALDGYERAVEGLARRVPSNELGSLLPEVERLRPPSLRGGHDRSEADRERLERLNARRSQVEEVAGQFAGMTLIPGPGPKTFIDATEVTNADWQAFVEAGGYTNEALWTEEGLGVRDQCIDESGEPGPATWRDGAPPEGSMDHPVHGVGFHEALAYARWAGKDLPTLEQWQRAAVGGSRQRFPWGSRWVEGKANLRTPEAPGGTVSVGGYRGGGGPNGALDVIGNVEEVVHDALGGRYVAVGGSFETLPDQAALDATPIPLDKWYRLAGLGLRCAKVLEWN